MLVQIFLCNKMDRIDSRSNMVISVVVNSSPCLRRGSGRQATPSLKREGAVFQEKASHSLLKRGIFPEGKAYAKGEFGSGKFR